MGGDDDGVDGSDDEEDKTTYKKRKKNQPKTARDRQLASMRGQVIFSVNDFHLTSIFVGQL
jgi:hypothetical protein